MLFRKWGCLVGPENSIFRKLKSVDRKKMALTTETILHSHFHFKVFPEKERERERERVRTRGEDRAPVSPTIAGEFRAPVRADLARLRSTLREIAISDCDRRRGRRTGAREIGADWSSEFTGDRRTDWSSVFSSRACALSLSLSLSLSLFPEIL